MKITNQLNLPQPLFDAIANDDYHKGDCDYSITELIGPPRVRRLTLNHWDEIEVDASSRIFSLLGRAVHIILERHDENDLSEERYYATVSGKKISGQVDRFVLHNGELTDYKVVTLYKVKGNKIPDEYTQQLNGYAHLLRANNLEVKSLWLLAILRDWSKMKVEREFDYPKQQVLRLPALIWDPKMTEKFLEERVRVHEEAALKLPFCSPEERWQRPTQYAAIKKGAKRATKLFPSKEEALKFAQTNDLYVEDRPAEAIRCSHYCDVSGFCTQYKGELGVSGN